MALLKPKPIQATTCVKNFLNQLETLDFNLKQKFEPRRILAQCLALRELLDQVEQISGMNYKTEVKRAITKLEDLLEFTIKNGCDDKDRKIILDEWIENSLEIIELLRENTNNHKCKL